MRKFIIPLAFASLSFGAPLAPAAAQTPGMQVVDTNGGAVGVVTAIKGDLVTVKTDKHEVALPKTSFTVHEGKLLFGMTQASPLSSVSLSGPGSEFAASPPPDVRRSCSRTSSANLSNR